MRILLVSVGRRMPSWVDTGFREYVKRMPRELSLELIEIDPGHRGKGGPPQLARRTEGKRMLAKLPKDARVIALDVRGRAWSTEEVARRLASWMAEGSDLALLVGGPEGLDHACIERAEHSWSLSKLTFPHQLVRIIVAEQLYRAWSLLKGHPYHRR